jgi:hypothetical protein
MAKMCTSLEMNAAAVVMEISSLVFGRAPHPTQAEQSRVAEKDSGHHPGFRNKVYATFNAAR